jgi:pilus assembly protein Flp/PilA
MLLPRRFRRKEAETAADCTNAPLQFHLYCSLAAPTIRQHNGVTMTMFKRFLHDQSGATAIEYGLIAAGISVAIIATVNTLGSQLKTTFTTVSSQLATAGK